MTTKSKPATKTAKTTTKSKPSAKPTKEELRESVLADQAAARSAVAASRAESQTAPPTKPTKTGKVPAGSITVLAKENPHAGGSKRAQWFAELRSGMTVADAVAKGCALDVHSEDGR